MPGLRVLGLFTSFFFLHGNSLLLLSYALVGTISLIPARRLAFIATLPYPVIILPM